MGRQPGRRLAAPLPRRGRERLARAAGDRGALATPGWRTATSPAPPDLPFAVLRGYRGTDLPEHTAAIEPIDCPFTGERFTAVPAISPDVAIIHAQRADRDGNVQLWGLTGVQKEAVLAADRSLVTVEEIVDELEPRPNAVVLPRWVVTARGRGAGRRPPSYAHDYYERDNAAYKAWDAISRDRDGSASGSRRCERSRAQAGRPTR